MITESTMPCAPPVSARRVGPEPSVRYRDPLHTVGRMAGAGSIARGRKDAAGISAGPGGT